MAVSTYRKRRIPDAVRRDVLRNAGAEFGRVTAVECHYCGSDGWVRWTLSRSWPTVTLELDHVVPEVLGGENVAENFVLACRWCNRSKGHTRALPRTVDATP